MRLLFYVLAAACLLAGILFGALNAESAHVDLYFVQFDLMLGVALLLAMLVGALLSWLMLSLGVIWPLQRRLSKERKQSRQAAKLAESASAPTSDPGLGSAETRGA